MRNRGVVVSLMAPAVALAAWAACLPSEPAILPYDAGGSPADGDVDSAVDAGECDLDGKFGAPQRIFQEPTLGDRRGAFLAAEELTLYYAYQPPSVDAQTASFWKLRRVTRARPGDRFREEESTLIEELSKNAGQRDPTFSKDENLIVYSVSEQGQGHHLYYSARDAAADAFDPPRRAAIATDNHSTITPFLDTRADGVVDLWFARGLDSGRFDIHRARVNDSNLQDPTAFGVPQRVMELADPSGNYRPVLSIDGREIFFTRGDVSGNGSIWTARRETPDKDFVNIHRVDEFFESGGIADEGPAWLSADRCRLYLSSSRDYPDKNRNWSDLYVAERPRKTMRSR